MIELGDLGKKKKRQDKKACRVCPRFLDDNI